VCSPESSESDTQSEASEGEGGEGRTEAKGSNLEDGHGKEKREGKDDEGEVMEEVEDSDEEPKAAVGRKAPPAAKPKAKAEPPKGSILHFMKKTEGPSRPAPAAVAMRPPAPRAPPPASAELWIDKHRPTRAADLSIPTKKVNQVRQWLVDALAGSGPWKVRPHHATCSCDTC
jgi:hypothetical protein